MSTNLVDISFSVVKFGESNLSKFRNGNSSSELWTLPSTITWRDLELMLKLHYGVQSLAVTYIDEEEDEVSVNSEAELAEALCLITRCRIDVPLKMKVYMFDQDYYNSGRTNSGVVQPSKSKSTEGGKLKDPSREKCFTSPDSSLVKTSEEKKVTPSSVESQIPAPRYTSIAEITVQDKKARSMHPSNLPTNTDNVLIGGFASPVIGTVNGTDNNAPAIHDKEKDSLSLLYRFLSESSSDESFCSMPELEEITSDSDSCSEMFLSEVDGAYAKLSEAEGVDDVARENTGPAADGSFAEEVRCSSVALSTSSLESGQPPPWFMEYMTTFKNQLAHDVTSRVYKRMVKTERTRNTRGCAECKHSASKRRLLPGKTGEIKNDVSPLCVFIDPETKESKHVATQSGHNPEMKASKHAATQSTSHCPDLSRIYKDEPRRHAKCIFCCREMTGVRYKCAICADFVLCESCEEKGRGDIIHLTDHAFIRIKIPAKAAKSATAAIPDFDFENATADLAKKWEELKKIRERVEEKKAAIKEDRIARKQMKKKKHEAKKESKKERKHKHKKCRCKETGMCKNCHAVTSANLKKVEEKLTKTYEDSLMPHKVKVDNTAKDVKEEEKADHEKEKVFSTIPYVPFGSWYKLDAKFLWDESIPDGAQMKPGSRFIKHWRVMNNGTVTWPRHVELKYLWGSVKAVEGGAVISQLQPGEKGIVSVQCIAPSTPGHHESHWTLCSEGRRFGHRLWVSILVVSASDSFATSVSHIPLLSKNDLLTTANEKSTPPQEGLAVAARATSAKNPQVITKYGTVTKQPAKSDFEKLNSGSGKADVDPDLIKFSAKEVTDAPAEPSEAKANNLDLDWLVVKGDWHKPKDCSKLEISQDIQEHLTGITQKFSKLCIIPGIGEPAKDAERVDMEPVKSTATKTETSNGDRPASVDGTGIVSPGNVSNEIWEMIQNRIDVENKEKRRSEEYTDPPMVCTENFDRGDKKEEEEECNEEVCAIVQSDSKMVNEEKDVQTEFELLERLAKPSQTATPANTPLDISPSKSPEPPEDEEEAAAGADDEDKKDEEAKSTVSSVDSDYIVVNLPLCFDTNIPMEKLRAEQDLASREDCADIVSHLLSSTDTVPARIGNDEKTPTSPDYEVIDGTVEGEDDCQARAEEDIGNLDDYIIQEDNISVLETDGDIVVERSTSIVDVVSSKSAEEENEKATLASASQENVWPSSKEPTSANEDEYCPEHSPRKNSAGNVVRQRQPSFRAPEFEATDEGLVEVSCSGARYCKDSATPKFVVSSDGLTADLEQSHDGCGKFVVSADGLVVAKSDENASTDDAPQDQGEKGNCENEDASTAHVQSDCGTPSTEHSEAGSPGATSTEQSNCPPPVGTATASGNAGNDRFLGQMFTNAWNTMFGVPGNGHQQQQQHQTSHHTHTRYQAPYVPKQQTWKPPPAWAPPPQAPWVPPPAWTPPSQQTAWEQPPPPWFPPQPNSPPQWWNAGWRSPTTHMDRLLDMGFCNRDLNKRLLDKHNGDINKVIVELLEFTDNNWFHERH